MPRYRFAHIAIAISLAAVTANAQFETTEVSGPGAPPLWMTRTTWNFEDLAPTVPGATYNFYRKLPGDDFRCLVSNLTAPTWTGDPASPAPGEVWWYSVNGDDTWSENLHGSSRPIIERCPCSGPAPRPGTNLQLVSAATGFQSPVFLISPPGDRTRLFIVEQRGTIRIVKRGATLPLAFLDIQTLVQSQTSGNEKGLLSMSFHPNYATNGYFYVYYTAVPDGRTVVARYAVSGTDPDIANPSGTILLEQSQPFTNHNGGQLHFGPDGFLYIGLGDGGSGGDPMGNGQNLMTFLGKILRIDVDGAAPYAVPPTNPFVGMAGALPEIWSYGLRNPWRFSFDRFNGDLYIADVGQGTFEEVDVQPAASAGGENYGWNTYEGSSCFSGPCSPAGMTFPVTEYPRSVGQSITGGYVYRGCGLPDLVGTYFYADYQSEYIASFEYVGGAATNPINWTGSLTAPPLNAPTSFGEDAGGEIYVLNRGGTIYRIESR